MKTLQQLKAALPAKHEREALERVASESQVPYHTLLKVVNGATKSPRYDTVARLFAYVESAKGKRRSRSAEQVAA